MTVRGQNQNFGRILAAPFQNVTGPQREAQFNGPWPKCDQNASVAKNFGTVAKMFGHLHEKRVQNQHHAWPELTAAWPKSTIPWPKWKACVAEMVGESNAWSQPPCLPTSPKLPHKEPFTGKPNMEYASASDTKNCLCTNVST